MGFWERNRAALAAADPALAARLDAVEPYETRPARSGDPTISLGRAALHSRYDPRAEAERAAAGLEAPAGATVVLLGLGLGYHLEAARRRFPSAPLVAVEADARLARTALEARDLSAPLAGGARLLVGLAPAAVGRALAGRRAVLWTPPGPAGAAPEYYAAVRAALAAAPTSAAASAAQPPVAAGRPDRPLRVFSNHMNGLGDMILAAPVLRELKRRGAEITVLVWPYLVSLARGLPYVDRIVEFGPRQATEEGFRALLAALGDGLGPFDVALDFAHPPRSTLVAAATRAPRRFGWSNGPDDLRARYTDVLPNPAGLSRIERNLAILEALGLPRPETVSIDFVPEPADYAEAHAILRDAGVGPADRLVVMHPGGGVLARRWPAERFARLADAIAERWGAKVLLLEAGVGQAGIVAQMRGERTEENAVRAVLRAARRRHASTRGRDTTLSLAVLLRRASLFVGNNSGPMHLAGALGIPTVGLWGPSDAREFCPMGAEVEVAIDVEGLPCYPCPTTGCAEPVCLRDRLTVERVLGAIERRWGGVPPARPLPLAVELGAGERQVAGAIHVDLRPLPGVRVVADVRRLPFRTGSVDRLHAAHLIEHFPRADLPAVVAEWRRAVAPGGALSVVTPNLGYVVEEYRAGRMTTPEAATRLFGGQDYAGNFHYHVFDAASLAATLEAAGFATVHETTRRYESRPHPMSLYAVAVAPGAERPARVAASGPAWTPEALGVVPTGEPKAA